MDNFTIGLAAVWHLYAAAVLIFGAAWFAAWVWHMVARPSDYVGLVKSGRERGRGE